MINFWLKHWNLILSVWWFYLAWSCNALMDSSSENEFKKDFWNKSKSWKYKYKKGLLPYQKKWYFFGLYEPNYEERFPFSTTFLVGFTDGWHLLKMLFISFILLSIFFASNFNIYLLVSLKIAMCLGFNLLYQKINKL